MPDAHALLSKVNRFDFRDPHVRAVDHLSQRLDDVGQGNIAARYFVEHRGEEDKVLLRDHGNFDIGSGTQAFFEVSRSVGAGKTAAKNQDALLARSLGGY